MTVISVTPLVDRSRSRRNPDSVRFEAASKEGGKNLLAPREGNSMLDNRMHASAGLKSNLQAQLGPSSGQNSIAPSATRRESLATHADARGHETFLPPAPPLAYFNAINEDV